ncbi:hypothetical protein MKW98_022870 [Papaver atlanticum]|uniref:SAWADEE domain-containing protein n=1 Tax=Papaver atlanticum TaxID=357466 RepID=A0AAD4XZ86_9MAGN|nr:hypothetical protein MKW98_022870 [Papaver atlanticum]
MGRLPKKSNQNLDFRSTKDDAWYTVGKLSLEKNILIVRFAGFDKEDNEKFSAKDFKTLKELDDFLNRFRPACVQLQDEECPYLSRGYEVCALLDQGEEDKKFYNGIIESISSKRHRRIGGKVTCSCAFVVGWSEGPKASSTQQMGIEGICKIIQGSPLFHRALDCFMKMSSKQLDLVSNENQLPVKKRSR